MRSAKPKPGYRHCVGIMLLNHQGLVFVGRRIEREFSEAWQMPQGGIDRGETPRQAALRELEEEVGTAKAEILAEHPDWLSYDLPSPLARRSWRGRYRGQSQKWFAMRFKGDDRDIRLDAHHREFAEWRWTAIGELTRFVVPFKRAVYQDVVEAFDVLAEPV